MKRVVLRNLPENSWEVNEACKQFRTNVMFCGDNIKSVMLTSTFPNEGKSNVSFQLARSLAENGKRVVLIDADIRKSVLAARLDADQKVSGLSHYLAGKADLNDVLCQVNVPNLYIVFSGVVVPNPSELLGGAKFKAMLSSFSDVFDYIIIDSPPIGSVTDASVIGSAVDGCVLVVRWNSVSYKDVRKAKAQLEKANCRMLGAVLNAVDHHKEGYYGRYGKYYGGYYGGYYGSDDGKGGK